MWKRRFEFGHDLLFSLAITWWVVVLNLYSRSRSALVRLSSSICIFYLGLAVSEYRLSSLVYQW